MVPTCVELLYSSLLPVTHIIVLFCRKLLQISDIGKKFLSIDQIFVYIIEIIQKDIPPINKLIKCALYLTLLIFKKLRVILVQDIERLHLIN